MGVGRQKGREIKHMSCEGEGMGILEVEGWCKLDGAGETAAGIRRNQAETKTYGNDTEKEATLFTHSKF